MIAILKQTTRVFLLSSLNVVLLNTQFVHANSNIEAMVEGMIAMGKHEQNLKKEAIKEFNENLKKANKGDAKAQYEVGTTYYYPLSRAVKSDPKIGFQWLLKSAKQGYAPAQEYLAKAYLKGRGVEKNVQQAFQWFTKAADQGSVESQFNLAHIYEDGLLGKVDPAKAISIYQSIIVAKADATSINQAQRGVIRNYLKVYPNNGAQLVELTEQAYEAGWTPYIYDLLKYYSDGKYVPVNEAKQIYYLEKMDERVGLDVKQMFKLAQLTEKGTTEQKRKSQKLMQELVDRGYDPAIGYINLSAAQKGNAQAQVKVAKGLMYNYNKTEEEIDQIIYWLESASKQKSTEADHLLAKFHLNPRAGKAYGVEKAIVIYEKLAQNNDSQAQEILISYYAERDPKKAQFWLENLVKQQNAKGQFMLGYAKFSGSLGYERDMQAAVQWFQKAAAQNLPQAVYEMGHMYEHGHGVDVNLSKAKEWYNKAKTMGDYRAEQKLQSLK